ncbi:MAG: AAA family ATPase [Pseudomonadota bacterium]
MKLKSLHIQNFRALEDFTVQKLGRLNLIVGKNNSGKSSVLEALRIYAGSANRALLNSIAAEHDEKQMIETESFNEDDEFPYASFFTGRCFPEDGKTIFIGEHGNLLQSIQLSHTYLIETKDTSSDENGETNTRIRRVPIAKSDIKITDYGNLAQAIKVLKNNNRSSTILLDEASSLRSLGSLLDVKETLPCSYIPTQFVLLDELADEWDKITLTEYEDIVRKALKLIESKFENISFVKDDGFSALSSLSRRARGFKRSAIVKMENIKHPVPLKSMGDGMLRVLQLALKIYPAKGGFMLIDEFENGLHFSVQEKVWHLLFKLAEQLDIQVFATTHSWDCIESFAKVAIQHENIEGVLFRVGRSVRTSDNGKIIATEFNEEQLANLTQADVEVR